MQSQIKDEQSKMQIAHELAREKDKKILEEKIKEVEVEKIKDLTKEVKKMKEILGQEFEFRV